MSPGKKRVDQAFVCEGLDENSWQSRPRHAVLSPAPGRLPPRGTIAADLARVMLLLDASTIAKNVGRRLLFTGSRRAARSHSDLGGCATALPAWQTARLCAWHACASVWIATSFRPRPRIHKHANAWWSMHLHTLLLDTSKAQLAFVSDLCRHHRHMHGNHRRTPAHAAPRRRVRRAGGMGIDCCWGTTRRAAHCRHAADRSGGGPGSQRGPRSICFATPSPLSPAAWQGRVAEVGRVADKEGRFRKFRTVAF